MGSLHESLRLYLICKNMKWTHLPIAGGLYDQHPKLMDDFFLLMNAESEHQAKKNKNQMGPGKQGKAKGVKRRGR